MVKVKIKTGDTVKIISGNDKGKTGEVLFFLWVFLESVI